jgi:hypothetical protein
VLQRYELERGTNGVSNGIGRLDVSTQNFADIVDLRKYLLAQIQVNATVRYAAPNSAAELLRGHVVSTG